MPAKAMYSDWARFSKPTVYWSEHLKICISSVLTVPARSEATKLTRKQCQDQAKTLLRPVDNL